VAWLARSAFISSLNEILLVAAFVLFAGAILAFALVRPQTSSRAGPRRRRPVAATGG
jgi:hypothetical protein